MKVHESPFAQIARTKIQSHRREKHKGDVITQAMRTTLVEVKLGAFTVTRRRSDNCTSIPERQDWNPVLAEIFQPVILLLLTYAHNYGDYVTYINVEQHSTIIRWWVT